MSEQYFKFDEFNVRRAMRGAPAARVLVSKEGHWLWMSSKDVRANIKEFGEHVELTKALEAYAAVNR